MAAGTGRSPVCHLWDDVVPVLVVCAKTGVVRAAPPFYPPPPQGLSPGAEPGTHPASCRRGRRPAGRSARTGTPPAAPPARAGPPACGGTGWGDASPGVLLKPPPPHFFPPIISPGVVDGGPAVHVGRPGVGAVDHQQLCLQDLPGLGRHVQRRGALLLRAPRASTSRSGAGAHPGGLRDPQCHTADPTTSPTARGAHRVEEVGLSPQREQAQAGLQVARPHAGVQLLRGEMRCGGGK